MTDKKKAPKPGLRRRVYRVGLEFLWRMLRDWSPKDEQEFMDLPQAANLPEDARVMYADVDFFRSRAINFVIESEEFDEIPECYAYPVCELQMKTVRIPIETLGRDKSDTGFLVGFLDGTEKIRQMVEKIAKSEGDPNDRGHKTRVETAQQISNNIRTLQFQTHAVTDAEKR